MKQTKYTNTHNHSQIFSDQVPGIYPGTDAYWPFKHLIDSAPH